MEELEIIDSEWIHGNYDNDVPSRKLRLVGGNSLNRPERIPGAKSRQQICNLPVTRYLKVLY